MLSVKYRLHFRSNVSYIYLKATGRLHFLDIPEKSEHRNDIVIVNIRYLTLVIRLCSSSPAAENHERGGIRKYLNF